MFDFVTPLFAWFIESCPHDNQTRATPILRYHCVRCLDTMQRAIVIDSVTRPR